MDRLIDFIDYFQAKYVALFFAVVSILEFIYIRLIKYEHDELEKKHNGLTRAYNALEESKTSTKINRASSATTLTGCKSQSKDSNNCVSKLNSKTTTNVVEEKTDHNTHKSESPKPTRHEEKKQHFYLKANNQSVFLKWSDSIDDESKFKATLISENKATIELIDVNRIKSLPGIGEVVFESGTTQLKDAVSFKPMDSGLIIKEQQGATCYWKIEKKIRVEYTK